MSDETLFRIGAEASCSDGVCGEVVRVVVDPVARAVTHLVVEPKHHRGVSRLVPLDLVDAREGDIGLSCTSAEFDKLDPAEETKFLPGSEGYGRYGPGQAVVWPYYGLITGGVGGMGLTGSSLGMDGAPQPVTYETAPAGEVVVHRGDHVHATDGDVGQVQGLVIDPADHKVTHVLLQEGHLWGRKQVTIPIGAIRRIDQGIEVTMTKQQVHSLPSVAIDHPEA